MRKLINALKKLELPKEALMNYPLITMTGKEEVMIENYKGILEYSEERIRISTSAGVLRLTGKKLLLRQVTSDNIGIIGVIDKIEFLV